MLIEVESLKELEPGKTYALQVTNKNDEESKWIYRSVNRITECYGIYFIIFDDKHIRLIDAPKEMEVT